MRVRSGFAGASLAASAMLLGIGAGSQLVPTLHPLGALARMLDAFSPAFVAAGLVCALISIVLGARWIGALLFGLCVLAGGALVSGYRDVTVPLAEGATGSSLRVLFFNADQGNTASAEAIVTAAIAASPDILIFAEADAVRPQLDRLGEAYNFVSDCTAEACELLIATNLNVRRSWQLQLNPVWAERYAVLEVETQDETPVFIAAVHLAKPWLSGIAESEMARLQAQLNWFEGPVAVVGDFNMPPWSRPMRVVLRDTGFRALRGQPATWPVDPGPTLLPIDQILTRDGVQVQSVEVFGAGLGSNHLGLIADISVP